MAGLVFSGMTDDCSDVTTMCDRMGRSSSIESLISQVGTGLSLHDLSGASMTTILISSGASRAKEDSFDNSGLRMQTNLPTKEHRGLVGRDPVLIINTMDGRY